MSTTHTGTKIAFAAGKPATIDQTGFEAMAWGDDMPAGLVSIGAVGDTHETVSAPDMTVGRNMTLKGAVTGDVVPISLSRKRVASTGALDALQAALKAAAKVKCGEYSLRITEPDCGGVPGMVQYICGPVMNWKETERTTTSYAGATVDMAINYEPVDIYPAPPP